VPAVVRSIPQHADIIRRKYALLAASLREDCAIAQCGGNGLSRLAITFAKKIVDITVR
jgi:hypothetical protein